MLEDTIREQIKQAMRDRDEIARDILKLALGEVTSARAVGDVSEEQAAKLIRKIVEANHESIAALQSRGGDDDRIARLQREIEVLEALLPKQWSADDVEQFLRNEAAVLDQIRGAKADGQAMGVAMKTLKARGAPVDGKVVGEVVRKLRA